MYRAIGANFHDSIPNDASLPLVEGHLGYFPLENLREAYLFFWFPSAHGRQNERAGARKKKKQKNVR